MKISLSLVTSIVLSLVVLSACTTTVSNSGTQSQATESTSNRSSSDSGFRGPPSGSGFGSRGGRHESVTPEVKSISAGSQTQNTDSTTTTKKTVSYVTPAGTISTDFSITTDSSGNITATQAEYAGNDHEDAMYHVRFNSSVSSQIVGKSIKNLSLSAVGGASLTTDAFNKMASSLN